MRRDENQNQNKLDATKSGLRELARRDLLKGAAAGVLGAGLVGAGEATMAQESKADCPQILRVSKGVTAKIRNWKCEPCTCKDQRNFLISFAFSGPVMSNKRCDETANQIPDKSELTGRLQLKLRSGKCPETDTDMLWGCQEGRFRLGGVGGLTVMSGPITGTSGFNPGPDAKERCCYSYSRGTMKGKGIETLTGCDLCASYFLKIPYQSFASPCKTPPTEVIWMIDGVLICPCPK